MVPIVYALLALCVAFAASVEVRAAEGDDAGERVARSAAGYSADRDPAALRDRSTLQESRLAPGDVVTKPRSSGGEASRTASASSMDHWIYDADTEIFFDEDGDGYYRYLRVLFDVDSYHDPAWVYAKLWLSADGEVWELLYETADFRVDGASPHDEYEVETELLQSYPPALYDVLVEVYDADTGDFVDEFGPAQSSVFALLPLEDADHDGIDPPPVIIVNEGGGGAVSWTFLAVLAVGAAAAFASRRRRSPAA